MSKGSYRSSFESLVDDHDYQLLTPLAQSILHTLKLKLGQYGIAVFYLSALEEIHQRANASEIRAAVKELEATKPSGERGWIARERNVVWIVNGLKHDPSWVQSNTNNQKGAATFVGSLPRLAIVAEFATLYGVAYKPLTRGRGTTETDTETETESGKRSVIGKEAVHIPTSRDGKSNSPLSGESNNNRNSTNTWTEEFLGVFYAAPGTRRDDIQRQLSALLTDKGVKLGKKNHSVQVWAVDAQHLHETCAVVIAEENDPKKKLDDPDKAIVKLLKKLNESRLEVTSARSRPSEPHRVRPLDGGSPTRIGDVVAKAVA
jgi:hypothetical protein